MIGNKKYLVASLAACVFGAPYAYGGAGGLFEGLQNLLDNEAIQNAFQNVGDGIGHAWNKGAEVREQYAKERREAHERRIRDLHKKANDRSLPEWEQDAAQRELLEEMGAANRTQRKQEEWEDSIRNMGTNLVNQGLQGAMQEGLAQLAHGRELEKVGLQAVQNRKASVERMKEIIKAFSDPKNVGLAVLGAGGVFGMYFGLKHGIGHVADQYKKPALADEDKTSLKFGPLNYIKSLIYGTEQVESSLSDVILKPELAQRADETVQTLKNTVKNGGFLKHTMLWGQPGTGKTMLAMRMARSSGLEYIYFSASSLEQLSTEEASKQLVQLFRYAISSPKKLMIIIDEAEKLLGSRKNADVSDKKQTLLNLILTYTGTETRDYMVTVLTNIPEDIDEAFLSRCDERIQIGAPEPRERRAILQLYVDKFLKSASNLKPHKPSIFSTKYWLGKEDPINPPAVAEGALSDSAVDALSDKLNGFVGRDISKLVIQIQSSALATEDNKITTALIDRVVKTKLAERREQAAGFVRDGSKAAPAA